MVKTSENFEGSAKLILKDLPSRARDVVERRFGIGNRTQKQTLESIGKNYKITRERVRQIEAFAISKMRASASFVSVTEPIFSNLAKEFNIREKVWREDYVLSHFAENEAEKNYVYFFLSLGRSFERIGADSEFYNRWTNDVSRIPDIEKTIRNFCVGLEDEPMKRGEIAVRFGRHVEAELGKKLENDGIFAWLGISKDISCNNFDEWGLAKSPLVKPSGMRDFAYLVLKRHGSPLHFREVAFSIEKLADKKAHVQTVHNELIKDERFILVGRGLYALSTWGYQSGTVKDIVTNLLKKHGPISKEELIRLVKQERHVKDNTIIINLQNQKKFKKLSDGRYHVA